MIKISRLHAFGLLGLALAAPVHAAAPPDDFRSNFVGALATCTYAYHALTLNRELGSADDDMRVAASSQERGAFEILLEWSRLTPGDAYLLIREAGREVERGGIDSRDELVDLASYCDEKLNDFLDTAKARGYTP